MRIVNNCKYQINDAAGRPEGGACLLSLQTSRAPPRVPEWGWDPTAKFAGGYGARFRHFVGTVRGVCRNVYWSNVWVRPASAPRFPCPQIRRTKTRLTSGGG